MRDGRRRLELDEEVIKRASEKRRAGIGGRGEDC